MLSNYRPNGQPQLQTSFQVRCQPLNSRKKERIKNGIKMVIRPTALSPNDLLLCYIDISLKASTSSINLDYSYHNQRGCAKSSR